ncbi:MAG: hypothetical protein ACOCP1_03860 [Campylobacterales bacterium]
MIDKIRKNRADLYIDRSKIQKNIAKKLISKISEKPKKIVDLGCGTGYVYEAIEWELDSFIAVDRDFALLQRHPRRPEIECVCNDFDTMWLPSNYSYFSSSSLQWSMNLEALIDSIKKRTNQVAIAIFSSQSFKHFHNEIGSSSPLYSSDEIRRVFLKNFLDITLEFETIDVEFEDARSLVDFLRYSGMFKRDREINYKLAKKAINLEITKDSIEILYAYNI